MWKYVSFFIVCFVLILAGCGRPTQSPNIQNLSGNVSFVQKHLEVIGKNAEDILTTTSESETRAKAVIIADEKELALAATEDVLASTAGLQKELDQKDKKIANLTERLSSNNAWLYWVMNVAGLVLIAIGLYVLFWIKDKMGFGWIGCGIGSISMAYFLSLYIFWIGLAFIGTSVLFIGYQAYKWHTTPTDMKALAEAKKGK